MRNESRQVRRRRQFNESFAGVNFEFRAEPCRNDGYQAPVRYTIPRRARRKIARNRLRIAAKQARAAA